MLSSAIFARVRKSAALLCVILLGLDATAARAGHVDPAPVPDEVVQRLVQDRLPPPDMLPLELSQRLDETQILIQNVEQQNARPDSEAEERDTVLADDRNLIESKIAELETLRSAAHARLATLRARFESLGMTGKLKEWDTLTANVDDRFDRIEKALNAVRDASDTDGRARALTQAKDELRVLHDDVKARQEASGQEPTPNWRTQSLQPPHSEKPSDHEPEYLSYRQQGLENAYAYLGNTLLAAIAPPTPASAASCSYTAADLAATPDVQITPEIQALAAKLDYSPAKIFQYVYTNVKFEPYYGSLKGSTGTLYAMSGNSTDQASLLIALLRASNIPARYVKGQIFVQDPAPDVLGGRAASWVGAKSYIAAASIFADGQNPGAGTVTNSSSQVVGISATHIWVEACVPYSHYRGAESDTAGSRWVPLDPSFKDETYQPGIATNVNFDYTGYLAKRSTLLPEEWYDNQVNSYIKGVAPNFANNTLADVPYTGTEVPLNVDVLPASLPYEVNAFLNWAGTTSPEIAQLPDTHRYKFSISVANSTGTALTAAPITLTMPQTVLSRVTLSFQGATPADQTALTTWQNDANLASTMPCTVNVVPVIRVDGIVQATGATAVGLCTTNNQLTLSVTLAELTNPTVNTTSYTNIGAADYHALFAYAFQTSDRLLAERTAKLLASVKATANPDSNLEETEGELLNVVGLKYLRYVSDSIKNIGQLDGGSGGSGNHLGLTSSVMKVQYLFDLPYAVERTGFLVDVPGGQSRSVDLSTGQVVWKTFLLDGYSGSAYESYIWQEAARMDAVSTVRGLQYANENGITVLILNAANWATQSPLLTSNANPALNYSAAQMATLNGLVTSGYTLNIPKSLIQYGNWTGSVWEEEKYDTVNHVIAAGFIIGGNYAGGYTVAPPVSVNSSYNTSTGSGSVIDTTMPATVSTSNSTSIVNSSTGANGINQFTTIAGDPVNMATGNLYHTERDIDIPSRGGMPIVFERSYNSRLPQPGPLGYGWTDSFNHFLKFYGVDATDGLVKVSWVDGTGGEKFFSATPVAGGVASGIVLNDAPGVFSVFQRQANGTYTIREKNGLTYTFASNAGATAGQTAQLLSIADRNGNTLTLNYSGANLASVADGAGRTVLTFAYDASSHITQITDLAGRIYQYGYTDGNNNLNSFKNPLAASGSQPAVTYQYYSAADGVSLNHAMKSYTLPRGNGMTFEYYTNGKVFRYTDPQGHTDTFTYNDFRHETVQVNQRSQARHFFFDPYGNPSRIVDENGGIYSYTYDTATPANVHNRLTETNPQGYVTHYAYDVNGNVTLITRPSGNTVAYGNFTAFNQPGKVKDANGNYTLLKYDAKGNLLQAIRLKQSACATLNCAALDPATYTPAAADMIAWSVNGYDAYGNLLSAKRVRDFTGQVASPTALSNTGPILTVAYDANALYPVSRARIGIANADVAPSTQSAALSFDTLGREVSGADADWQPVRFGYDSVDRVTSATDSLGHDRSYQFDVNGNPTGQRLDVNGTLEDSSSRAYDSNDRKISATDAGGNVTAYQYDEAGNLIQITSPDNYTLGFAYDAANQLIDAFDQKNHVVYRTLDALGRTRTVTDPNGNSTTYSYYDGTVDGRLKSVADAARHVMTYGYDANGNVTSVTVTGNDGTTTRTTLTFYDELNRPVRIVGPQYTDAVLGAIRPVTKYVYDALGDRTQVLAGYTTDATGANVALDVLNVQSTVAYDDFSRKTKVTDSLNHVWAYLYDANNNLISKTDAKGQLTRYTWDYGHQLMGIQGTQGQTFTYTRNALGQETEAQSPAVTYTYVYDAAHRLASLTDSRGNKTLNYSWSPGGLLNGMRDNDGNAVNYVYDPVGRLTGVWAPNGDVTNFFYDAGGRLTEKWFANGVNAQYAWNPDNTLASLTNMASGAVVSSHVYTYDPLGNRATDTETVNGTAIAYTYAYDPLNRLVQMGNGNATQQENYTYDPLGNRLTKAVNANAPVVTAYVYDAANQLKEIHSGSATGALLASLNYDPDGNLTGRSDTGLTLTYDALNRLVQANAGTQVSQYTYDDQGRRIAKTVNGATSNFLYNGPDIVDVYGATWGTPLAQYTHGPNQDEPLERITATSVQYFHHDGLGSIVAVSNSLGGLDATQRYDAWGNVVAATGTTPRYGYTGREPDETGLIYYRARYYDPTLGRFTQRDPAGFGGGINLYAYVNGNPINYTDPSGMVATTAINTVSTYFGNTVDAVGSTVLSGYQSASNSVSQFAQAHAQAIGNVVTGLGVVGTIGAEVFSVGTETPAVPGEIAGSVVAGEETTTALTAAQQLAANKAAGAAFEQTVGANLEQSGLNIGKQITVETQSGVRTRLDFLTQDPMTGKLGCVECKASPTAPLTPNQTLAFPEIEQTGGTIVGAGKPGFPGGTQLPPTSINIIRGP